MFAHIVPSRARPLIAAGVLAAFAFVLPIVSALGQTPPPAQLPETVVTATRTEIPLGHVGSSITVITGEEMEQQQTRLVSDALRQAPGLAVNRTGGVGGQTQVRIRGSEGNQTKVLIDGIEANDPAGGSEFDFANMLASDIDRIEILRGPQSLLYGSDAVGGVINIITRRGGGPLRATASLEGGSHNTQQATAGLAGGLAGDRLRYQLSATRYHTDGISAANSLRGNTEEDAYDNGTLFGAVGGTPIEHLDIDLTGRYVHSHLEGDDFVGGLGAVDGKSDSTLIQRYGRAQARLKLLDDKWVQRIALASSDNKNNSFSNGPQTSTFNGYRTKFDYQNDFTFSSDPLFPAEHTLSLGIDHMWDSAYSRSAFSTFDKSLETQSVWGQYQLALMDQFFFTGGARFDDNDMFEDATTFRLTAAWKVSGTGGKLRGSYGTGVKNPTLFELYGFTPTFRPNPDLQPEFGRGWDIGWDQQFLNGRVVLGATYFEQRIRDLITGAGDTSINLPGVSRSRGAELTGRIGILRDLDLSGSYTFTSTRDPDGSELVRRPKHIAGAGMTYRFLEDKGSATLGVVYNGATNDFAFDRFFNRSIVELDAYTTANLAVSYKLHENLEVFGRVENLTNEHYEEVYTYGSLGRSGYGGVKASF